MKLINDDCLNFMQSLPANSIDLVLTDPPYGFTDAPWDQCVDWNAFWPLLDRVTKPNAAVLIFASSKFTIQLAASNFKFFRYKYVWDKSPFSTGHLNSHKMPLKAYEEILVFYRKLPTYNIQKSFGFKNYRKHISTSTSELYENAKLSHTACYDGSRYPTDILRYRPINHTAFNQRYLRHSHPTQKPLPLLEFLIRTYSNEGDTVFDPFAGSGSTGVAALNNNRDFVLCEKEPRFFAAYHDLFKSATLSA